MIHKSSFFFFLNRMTQKDVPLYHNVKVHHFKHSHKKHHFQIISNIFIF